MHPKYTFEILIDRPNMLRPYRAKSDWRRKTKEPPEVSSSAGHMFFALVNPQGQRLVYGFHPLCAARDPSGAPVAKNLPPEDLLPAGAHRSPLKLVRGAVFDDSTRRYDDKRRYSITARQYQAMLAEVARWQQDTPKYSLLRHNCVDFTFAVAAAGGIYPPRHWQRLRSPVAASQTIMSVPKDRGFHLPTGWYLRAKQKHAPLDRPAELRSTHVGTAKHVRALDDAPNPSKNQQMAPPAPIPAPKP